MTGPRTLLIAALLAVLAGCGGQEPGDGASPSAAPAECRRQWAALGETVVGLDRETEPSSLAGRWSTVIATIDYYANGATAKDCADRLEKQQSDIDALRRLSEQLRPYDMSYQDRQTRAGIDLYLNDPLPEPVRDAKGAPVPPPSKAAVQKAAQTLSTTAAAADADLAPGWQALESASLTDGPALRTAVERLDAFARASEAWVRCEAALQVLVAAIRAQEGLSSP